MGEEHTVEDYECRPTVNRPLYRHLELSYFETIPKSKRGASCGNGFQVSDNNTVVFCESNTEYKTADDISVLSRVTL